MRRDQPSALVQWIVWVPLWVCPSSSPCPAGSMLQSETLFTFWTQLTSPSLGPQPFPPPPSISLALSDFLPVSLSLSLSVLLGFGLQPSLSKDLHLQWSSKNSLSLCRGERHCWMNAAPLCLTHYKISTHKHTHEGGLCSTLCACHTLKANHILCLPR